MIYLIDRGFRIKSALNILVNQVKYPEIYNECICLGCNVNQGTCFADVKYNVNDNVIDNDNVNDKAYVNDKDNVNVNDNVIDNDNDNANDSDNDIDIDNDLRSSFTNSDNDNDNFIYLFGEKHQKVKPNNNSPTNSISINTNDDLQSWLNDDDISTEAYIF